MKKALDGLLTLWVGLSTFITTLVVLVIVFGQTSGAIKLSALFIKLTNTVGM